MTSRLEVMLLLLAAGTAAMLPFAPADVAALLFLAAVLVGGT